MASPCNWFFTETRKQTNLYRCRDGCRVSRSPGDGMQICGNRFFTNKYNKCVASRLAGGFHCRSLRLRQDGVKSPSLFDLALQSLLHQLPRFRVDHRDLPIARAKIASYYHHRLAPFLRALVVLTATKSTRSTEADAVTGSKRPNQVDRG